MLEDAELILEFCEEAAENLNGIDMALLSLEESPEDREAVNAVFRPIHTIKGVAGFFNLSPICQLTHIAEDILVTSRDQGIALRPAVIDILFEVVDVLRKLIAKVKSEAAAGNLYQEVTAEVSQLMNRLKLASMDSGSKKLGEIMVEQGIIQEEDIQKALQQQEKGEQGRIGEVLIRSGRASSRDVAKAIREQKDTQIQESRKFQNDEGIRVSVEKLDRLVDMVGELVIAQIQVSSSEIADPKLNKNVVQFSKITREL
ncbi:MAG: Hpt domain-containing protein, partial [bacterium]